MSEGLAALSVYIFMVIFVSIVTGIVLTKLDGKDNEEFTAFISVFAGLTWPLSIPYMIFLILLSALTFIVRKCMRIVK